MKKFLLSFFIGMLVISGFAQSTYPVNGVVDERDKVYAFVHATLVIDPSTTTNDATLLIKSGKIVAAGAGVAIPSDAVIIDLTGKYI